MLLFVSVFSGSKKTRLLVAMATYQDWIAFREAVLSAYLMNRTEFFAVVRHSQVRDVEGLPDTAATRALLACQALRLVLPQRVCGHCDILLASSTSSRVDTNGLVLGMKVRVATCVSDKSTRLPPLAFSPKYSSTCG